jgi:hypothetical protein
MKKKRTIRNLPPEARRLSKDINAVQLAIRRIEKRMDKIAEMERENNAWRKRQEYYNSKQEHDPIFTDEIIEKAVDQIVTKGGE